MSLIPPFSVFMGDNPRAGAWARLPRDPPAGEWKWHIRSGGEGGGAPLAHLTPATVSASTSSGFGLWARSLSGNTFLMEPVWKMQHSSVYLITTKKEIHR